MTITGQAQKDASSSATEKVASGTEDLTHSHAEAEKAEAVLAERVLELSKELAKSVDGSLGARKSVPIRNSFVRSDDPKVRAPLSQLVTGGGGRGAAVPLMLYIALIWKCAKTPFDVKLPARKWAELLALPDPAGKGARRVANALQVLRDLHLIKLDRIHGEASRVTLLDESGDGSKYELPSTAYSRGGLKRDLYFKVSGKLWTSGALQQLTSPGLTMLLIFLEEGGYKLSEDPISKAMQTRPEGREVWFTTENFPARFGISASMRSRGTKELVDAHLLKTTRRPVGPPGTRATFTTEKVRKIYVLRGVALVEDPESRVKRRGGVTPNAVPDVKTAAKKTTRTRTQK